MKTKKNDRQGRTAASTLPVAAFEAESAHKRKKAMGVGVTP